MTIPKLSCNFKIKKSPNYALVRCEDLECGKENYGINVLSGICTWCGFDINRTEINREKATRTGE